MLKIEWKNLIGIALLLFGCFCIGTGIRMWIAAGSKQYLNPDDPGVSYVADWACTIDVNENVTQSQMHDRLVWCAEQHMLYLVAKEEEKALTLEEAAHEDGSWIDRQMNKYNLSNN